MSNQSRARDGDSEVTWHISVPMSLCECVVIDY